MATELEARGHDLGDGLWSARILADDPGEIRAVHEAYLDAGARVVVTASYQVSRDGFVAAGRSAQQADDALRTAVDVAREAVYGHDALVAASVGPYGAILHDGSEYRGRYGVSRDRLIDFHGERMAVIADSAPDVLAIETIPDLDEVSALVDVLADHPGIPAWLTMSCADGARTSAGQPIEDLVAIIADAPSVRAVGVNCTAPEHVESLLRRLSSAGAPALVAYPNSGRAWSPTAGWSGEGTDVGADLVERWREVPGVALIGGCCGVGPDSIAAISRSLSV
ncbi:MAG: Homocysteine S-methyltransferase [Actinomycetota bacterium]|jgi:homocysteine S-methyltransferase